MEDLSRGLAGALIRSYRREAGITQQQLADTAGVSVGVVRDAEQGRTTGLHAASARRLAGALRLNQRQAEGLARAAREKPGTAAEAGRAGGLRIGVLGPMAAWRGGVPVMLGPPLQRALLGLLALQPGTGLARSVIIDALWGEDPPATAVPMVQSYVSRLRLALGPDRPLATVGAGYRLELEGCELDLVAFGALARRGHEAWDAAEFAAACEAYAAALTLWRGEPVADAEVLRGHSAVARLSQQRAEAVADYAKAATAAGCPERALDELRQLAGREPLNERAHAWLMIALAGSGQQAAALSVYDQVRRRLDDQLGVRPSAELADAHTRVLRQQIPRTLAPDSAGGHPGPTFTIGPNPERSGPGARSGASRGGWEFVSLANCSASVRCGPAEKAGGVSDRAGQRGPAQGTPAPGEQGPNGQGPNGPGHAQPDDQQASQVVMILLRLFRALERVDAGLTPQQYRILKLAGAGGERSAKLAERLAVAKPTLTATADGLVAAGFARRDAEPGDRRVVRLCLTSSGHEAVDRADAAYTQWLDHLLAETAEPDQVLHALDLLNDAMDEVRRARHAARPEDSALNTTPSPHPAAPSAGHHAAGPGPA